MGIFNFVRNRKAVKADRSTEMGLAGHAAARDAINPSRAAAKDNPNSGVRAIKLDGSFESNARKRQMLDNLAAKYAEEGPME